MNLTIDLSDLPENVTDYALNEFEREVRVNLDEIIRIFEEDDHIKLDYERQEVSLTDTYITRLIAGAVMSGVTEDAFDNPETIRGGIDDAFEFNRVYDLSALPEEVTDYAFDQFHDRVHSPELEAAEERVFANECVEVDADDQCVEIHESLITAVLLDAMEEKVRDIEREVERGERNDYTYEDVRQMRSEVGHVFDA